MAKINDNITMLHGIALVLLLCISLGYVANSGDRLMKQWIKASYQISSQQPLVSKFISGKFGVNDALIFT